jgi:membrane protease YdiL (CAAX protease family)
LSDPPALPPNPASALPTSINRRRWWIHLLIMGLCPILAGVMRLGGVETSGPALTSGAKGLLLVCGYQLLFFAVIFGLAWLASRATRDDLLWRWRGGVWIVPLGMGYSVALRLGVGILMAMIYLVLILTHVTTPAALQSSVINNKPDVETLVDISALRHNPAYFWLTVTLVSFVLGGLREELWRSAFLAGLRALWPQRFGSRFGQIAAVGVAALFFGFAHLPMGLLAVGMTGLLGFGLGLIMVLHRSIWPAVIAHGMFDATTMVLLPWGMEKLHEVQRTLGH